MNNIFSTQGEVSPYGRGFLLFANALKIPRLLPALGLLTLSFAFGAASASRFDEVAVYTPGPSVPTDKTVQTLPNVLSARDVSLYQKILAAHRVADWQSANRLIDALSDPQLVGHILAHRYLKTSYKVSYDEARHWLLKFHDQTEAPRLYALAQSRKPTTGALPLPKPKQNSSFTRSGDEDTGGRDKPYVSPHPGSGWPRLKTRSRQVTTARAASDMLARLTAEETSVDPVLVDQTRARLAQILFLAGETQAAFIAAAAATRSVDELPETAWIAGLAAWRLNQKAEALRRFNQVSNASAASESTKAGAAFWAARAATELGRPLEAKQWLTRAAASSYTYYGLLARRKLGRDISLDWNLPGLTPRDLPGLKPFPAITRTLALTQIGLKSQAEAELRAVLPHLPAHLYRPMLTLAERGGSPALAMSLASDLQRRHGTRFDAGLYPIPHWTPRQGFSVNPALLYAIARHESQFTTGAKNPSGASGLLQIMPETASAMARQAGHSGDDPLDLSDPTVNMTLGQRLAITLLRHELVKGDLLRFAVAYAAGLGQLDKMLKKEGAAKTQDPLLFVETIPYAESRHFTKKMLANYWIYQRRLGQPTDSLTALAKNQIPSYYPGQYASVKGADP